MSELPLPIENPYTHEAIESGAAALVFFGNGFPTREEIIQEEIAARKAAAAEVPEAIEERGEA